MDDSGQQNSVVNVLAADVNHYEIQMGVSLRISVSRLHGCLLKQYVICWF